MSRWYVALPAWLLSILAAFLFWWWQGRPIAVVDAPSDKLPCVSYAPYRDRQTPFDEDLVISPLQIEQDLRQLSAITRCVRTYSTQQGLAEVPRIARDLGMQVMLGVWIGREDQKNRLEIETAIALANRYPHTVSAVIVGNEVLLRREQPQAALTDMISRVRRAVPSPVTYADVWEFWLKYPHIADAVDFITIHTLPYWEDDPVAVDRAVNHVHHIWRMMSEKFPGKPVFIGEAGWPSAGRMRQGALPSALNQARFIRELMAMAQAQRIGINLIESFDQPWKRRLEGTVGGFWGVFDAKHLPKFSLTGPVSNHPDWLDHFESSTTIATLLLITVWTSRYRRRFTTWLIAALAAQSIAGMLVIGVHTGLLSTHTAYDWFVLGSRWLIALSASVMFIYYLPRILDREDVVPPPTPIAELVNAVLHHKKCGQPWKGIALGIIRCLTLFGAAATSLCLVFDSRYRDFPVELFAPATIAFLVFAWTDRHLTRTADLSEERLLAAVAIGAGIIVTLLEGMDNTQALNWAAVCLALAATIGIEAYLRPAGLAIEPPGITSAHRRTACSPASSTPAEESSTP